MLATTEEANRAAMQGAIASAAANANLMADQKKGEVSAAGHGPWGGVGPTKEGDPWEGYMKCVMTQKKMRIKAVNKGDGAELKAWSESRSECSWNPGIDFTVPEFSFRSPAAGGATISDLLAQIEAQLRADLLAQIEEMSKFWTNKMRSHHASFKDADYRFTLTAGPSFKKCVFEGDELGPEEDILDKGGDSVCIWFEFEVEVTQVSRSKKITTSTCACVVM